MRHARDGAGSIAFPPRLRYRFALKQHAVDAAGKKVRKIMTWTTPTLVEICIGLEINGYLPAEF
jgi:coenzyme PQQ precursor peptide PqqA